MNQNTDIVTTCYGGIIPVIREMTRRGLPQLIDKTLNKKSPRKCNAKYKYSDMFISWIISAMCGAKRIDDITDLMEELEVIDGLSLPSHDTIGRMMKSLATKVKKQNRTTAYKTSNINFYDNNEILNRLLVEATVLMGVLKPGEEYTLDVDCTFINTKCIGAKSMKGKNQPGFYPMIFLINNLPVFVSMRNGNSAADFRSAETVSMVLDLLSEFGIEIKKVRTDGAGYRKELIQMLNERGTEFVTGTPANKHFKTMFTALNKTAWTKTNVETANEYRDCEIAEIKYNMSNVDSPVRVVALRVPKEPDKKKKKEKQEEKEERERAKMIKKKMSKLEKKGKLKSKNKRYESTDWNEVGNHKYKIITTNDFETSTEELIYLYNARGGSENNFKYMKADFGWFYPPFQQMNENTVFYIITALANNVFRAIAIMVDGHVKKLDLRARIKRFQKKFINTTAVCIDGGDEWIFKRKRKYYLKFC